MSIFFAFVPLKTKVYSVFLNVIIIYFSHMLAPEERQYFLVLGETAF